MVQLRDVIQLQTVAGAPVYVGDVTVIPQSQAVVLRGPNGGWVWNRPLAVRVESAEGSSTVPIFDVTRLAQLGLLGLTLIVSMIVSILAVSHRRQAG